MQNPSMPTPYDDVSVGDEACSAVSWSAIIGGTFAAIAVTLILVGFGTGMGFAFASPWTSHEGMSVPHFTYLAATWLIVVQWLSSGLGGYLTGRLRTKWVSVHTHEVFFRDTAHGFLTWSVATVVTALLFVVLASSMHPSRPMPQHEHGPANYAVNSLFRSERATDSVDQSTKDETADILMKGAKDGTISDDDRSYVSQMVVAHTGISQAEANQRVDNAGAKGKQMADTARKTATAVSIFTLLSLLIGAFIASVAAAIGGQERDAPYSGTVKRL